MKSVAGGMTRRPGQRRLWVQQGGTAATRLVVRWVLPIGVTVLALAVAFTRVDFSRLALTSDWLAPGALVASCAALAFGALLSCVRLQIVARQLGHPLRLGDAIVATTSGQLAGSFFFQIFGQTIARTAVLGKVGVSPSATLLLTGYERLIAAFISFSLAAAGAWYLFGRVAFDVASGGLELLKILMGIVAVTASGAAFVWGRPLAGWVRANFDRGSVPRVLHVLAISFAIQAATMTSYVMLARALAPSISVIDLVAASSIVMLAASIPISFAGWGLREVSAIYALGSIHVSGETSLVVALLIGLMSIGVTALLAFIATTWRRSPEALLDRPVAKSTRLDAASLVNWLIPLFTVSAVFFQIYVPIGHGKLNLNLADTVVLFGGGVFALGYVSAAGRWARGRLGGLTTFVFVTSAVLALALFHGWLVYGWSDWAFLKRGFGWVVLLAYAATGALIVIEAGGDGLRMVLRSLVVSGLAAVSVDLVLAALEHGGLHLPPGLIEVRIEAFAQNPNALAFQLLIVMAGIIAIGWQRARPWLLGLALAGLFFAGSRAGAGAALAVLSAAMALRFLRGRELLWAGAVAVVLVLLISGFPSAWLFGTGGLRALHVLALNVQSGAASSDSERWRSIVLGWRMFLDHPLFGAGLGAFYASYLREHGHGLVIHSVPVWLLAETGIIGLLAFLLPFGAIVRAEVARWGSTDPSRVVILLSLTAFAVMGCVHELLYQRILWLVLGAALVATHKASPSQEPPSPAAGRRLSATQPAT